MQTLTTEQQRQYEDLRRWFAYLTAYCARHDRTPDATREQIELAARDNAPSDVITYSGWETYSTAGRVMMPRLAERRQVFIVHDETGQPVRVWSRIGGRDGSVTRFAMEGMAARIREHGDPWRPTAAEEAARAMLASRGQAQR